MHAVAVRFELRLPGVSSLKEKRQIVRSLIEGVRNKFGVSVSEVGSNDLHGRAEIGVAMVSSETYQLAKVRHQVEKFISARPDVEVIRTDLFYLDEA